MRFAPVAYLLAALSCSCVAWETIVLPEQHEEHGTGYSLSRASDLWPDEVIEENRERFYAEEGEDSRPSD